MGRSMGVRIVEYQPTPNPNAMKCVVDVALPSLQSPTTRPRSYATVASASADPFAQRLLQVRGVRSVLLTDSWFTISKDATAEWNAVKLGVERAIAEV